MEPRTTTAARWRSRPVLRWAGLAAGWVVVLGVAAFVAIRLLGLTDREPVLYALATLTPWLVVPCLAVIVVGVLLRARVLVGCAVVLLVVVGIWVGPDLRFWSTGSAVDGPTAVIASANVGPGHRESAAMAEDLLSLDADVLAVVELTRPDRDALRAAGVDERYPYSFVDSRSGNWATGIYSKYPLSDTEILDLGYGEAPMAKATVELPSGPVTVVAVHTSQPLSDPARHAMELEQLREVADDAGGPVVLAGDFNATRQHQAFRELLEGGYLDAHLEAGRGWAATWPAGRKVPPFALIDHMVLSPDLAVASVREATVSGSDHRAVVATIGPAAS